MKPPLLLLLGAFVLIASGEFFYIFLGFDMKDLAVFLIVNSQLFASCCFRLCYADKVDNRLSFSLQTTEENRDQCSELTAWRARGSLFASRQTLSESCLRTFGCS